MRSPKDYVIAESEEELKSLLKKVKEESKKVGLSLWLRAEERGFSGLQVPPVGGESVEGRGTGCPHRWK